jgi:hypothetical protein
MDSDQTELQRLIDRLQSDPEFRKRMLADPEGTAQAEGFSIAPDELKRFMGQASASDEELGEGCEGTTVACGTTSPLCQSSAE